MLNQSKFYLLILFLGLFCGVFAQTSTFSHMLGPIGGNEHVVPKSFAMNATPITNPPSSWYYQYAVLSSYDLLNSGLNNSIALNTVTPDGYLNHPLNGPGRFKKYTFSHPDNPFDIPAMGAIKVLKDGANFIILAGSNDTASDLVGFVVMKVDNQFNLLWAKVYKNEYNLLNASDFKISGSELIICGSVSDNSLTTTRKPFMARVDKNTGAYYASYYYSLPLGYYGGFDAISEGTTNVCAGHYINNVGQRKLTITSLNPANGSFAFYNVYNTYNVVASKIKSYSVGAASCIYNGWMIVGSIQVLGSATLKDIFVGNLTQNLCSGNYTFVANTVSSPSYTNSVEELKDFVLTEPGKNSTTLKITAVGTLAFNNSQNSLLEFGFSYDAIANLMLGISSEYYPYGVGLGADANVGVAIQQKNANEVSLLGSLDVDLAMPRINITNTTIYGNTTFKDACKIPFIRHSVSAQSLISNAIATQPIELPITLPNINCTVSNISQNTSVLCTDITARYAKNIATENENLSISPNPATDHLNVQIPSGLGMNKLTVLNLNGQVMMEKTLDSDATELELNVNDLPNAMYILKLEGAAQPQMTKFVKQ